MSEEMQAVSTVVNVAFEGYSMAFKIASKLGAKVAQAIAKAFMCSMKKSKMKKLSKMCGEVSLDIIHKKDGQNLVYFSVKDTEYEKFISMCEKQGVCVCKLPDFNSGDGYTYIAVGANNQSAIQFNLDILTKEAVQKGRLKAGEKAGEECSVEDFVKSAPGLTDEEKIGNFIIRADEMYLEKYGNRGFPSSVEEKVNSTDEKAFSRSIGERPNTKFGTNLYEKYTISRSSIVDENEKSIIIQCGKNEYMSVDKELIGNISEKDIEIYAPIDTNTHQGIVFINDQDRNTEVILNSKGVEKALKGRENRVKEKAAKAAEQNIKHAKSITKNLGKGTEVIKR